MNCSFFFLASQVALVIKNLLANAEGIFLLGTHTHSLCILEKHVSQPVPFIIVFYRVLLMVMCPRNISEVFMYFFNWVWVVLCDILKNLVIYVYTRVYVTYTYICTCNDFSSNILLVFSFYLYMYSLLNLECCGFKVVHMV